MSSIAITNIVELRLEIERLRFESGEQRAALGERFKSPSALFSTVRSLLQNTAKGHNDASTLDYFSLISRFLIPFTLNKTLFRHSNFLVKMLVGVVSQKASGYVNEGSVEKIFAEGKAFLNKVFHQSASEPIPPKPPEAPGSTNTSQLPHEQN